MMTQFVFALSMGLGALCNGAPAGAAPASPAPPAVGKVDPAYARAARAAPAVFEGEIVRVERGPKAWSGTLVIYQAVTYRVTRVVTDRAGRLSTGAELTVRHPVVAQSATADTTEPQLRPALARVGNAVIVLAAWSDDRWTSTDENHGLVIADATHRAALPAP